MDVGRLLSREASVNGMVTGHRALHEHKRLSSLPSHAPSQGARSGSTGPTWVSFPSFSSWGLCEQEGHLATPSPSKLARYLF